ncbi:hypothetical protein P153DRAFT_391091 [Dothidotthia symphoricarpi CBS 119687]|uniref:Uncharacterized protein n=1 Tax=Dothidotthia symphoricarpi CBS 119687 TaxID=1392245 RepID=A0A6A5ZYF7_9PLEO|nr:uncharacterized protein P153DRAFT_391091 [Dothidotthia symphoricarpi CBS 119687]KAF2124055.1 hypothetical protein P153DRAFT_391091 [Dothidotthia symphoricarpi CBS 119687]
MSPLEIFSQYANPPTNYIGTTIFLSYIAAALYLTFTITFSLYRQYNNTSTSSSKTKGKGIGIKSQPQNIKIFAFLAGISFATLSWHMLNFLITSYLQWDGSKQLSQAGISGNKLKRWMLESTLFQDFAQELVSSEASVVWTQAAILGTWFWGVWTAREARKSNLDASAMWKFIALGQILPISFTSALGIVQLYLSSLSRSTNTAEKSQRKSVSLVLPTVVLNTCLLAQPFLRDHPLFVTTILFERLILLLPYSSHISLEDTEVTQSIIISAACAAGNVALMVKGVKIGEVLSGVWHGGSAVKALGWDAVLGGLISVVLWMRGGV